MGLRMKSRKSSSSLRKFLANGSLRQNSLAIANAMAWCTQTPTRGALSTGLFSGLFRGSGPEGPSGDPVPGGADPKTSRDVLPLSLGGLDMDMLGLRLGTLAPDPESQNNLSYSKPFARRPVQCS